MMGGSMDFDPAEQEAELGQLTIWSERRLGRTHIMCGHRNIKLVVRQSFRVFDSSVRGPCAKFT